MCFSSNASFGSGAVLSIVGILSVKKVQDPKQYLFASIPLIFGFQQLTEGFVWLSLLNPVFEVVQQLATYVFLTFAQVVWPLCVPIAMLLLERESRNKKILILLSIVGLLMSSYLAYCLFIYSASAHILGHHIFYELHFPTELKPYGAALYFAATVVPPFFSSIKRMWAVGLAVLISYIFTKLFFEEYVISVWCFFAAIISVVVFSIMKEIQIPLKATNITLVEV